MNNQKSFIEVQFPVSKVSKESYKERMANLGQTLTGLGKWWGRKPLIMVRAALLGLLMPASDDPKKDMEIFLKILTMDDEGLWLRKNKAIPVERVHELVSSEKRQKYFVKERDGKIKYSNEVKQDKKRELQKQAFNKLSYDEKLKYCVRPENIKDTSVLDWETINSHLGTSAGNIQKLFRELGEKRFGYVPTVGDCFCGGGNIPFEAARMGLNAYASELNPIAVLLTWASLNILGSSKEEINELKAFQKKIYDLADKQITEWGIEHNEEGWRADSYLYCFETKCPECGYTVPLAPSWVIGRGTKTVAILKKDEPGKRFDILIKSGVNDDALKNAEASGTIKDDHLHCPACPQKTHISVVRGDRKDSEGNMIYGLRKWQADEFVPRPDDVFQERLYCIRYTKEVNKNGKKKNIRRYVTPSEEDLEREQKVVELLKERFKDWQQRGYIPGTRIEEGDETSRLSRERGWFYWHQLFNPRQLLLHGLFIKLLENEAKNKSKFVVGLLGLNKCCNWNSKLSQWLSDSSNEKGAQTFSNQALNTLYNYNTRALTKLKTSWFYNINTFALNNNSTVEVKDARQVIQICDIWITDPPYADAINYHELSEFFLSWNQKGIKKVFPDWYTDSKRALAVRGKGRSFNTSMVEIYKNLTDYMPDNGLQVVMFTHQDVKVWAELALILWSASLKVTAAWNIATETEASGLKAGNYVKGTVLLVLHKQTSDATVFEDELYPEIEEEVKKQIDNMKMLDDKEDPNFNDADYLLAAYASSLKVLTSYKNIEGINVQYELSKDKENNSEPSPVEKMIRSAVKIAYDYLTPKGFDSFIWRTLAPFERFFIKGLEIEKQGSTQLSIYQELARGYGVNDYKEMLANTKANKARLKTAGEFKMSGMQSDKAKVSAVRNALTAIYRGRKEEKAETGRNWLRNELEGYWEKREHLVEILDFLSELEHHDHMAHWKEDAKYARIIRELVRSDGY
jgi:putative DNA methylase